MVNCFPLVTLTGPVTTAGVYTWVASTALPARFRPQSAISTFVNGSNNSSLVMVAVGIDFGTGVLSCNVFPNAPWVGSILVYQWNMTWSV